jgi:hypothetical protein
VSGARARATLLLLLAPAAAALVGCQAMNTPIYFNGNALLEATPAPGNEQPRVKDAVSLRFRNPTDAERKDLDARRSAADPVKVPWIARDNVHVEVLFTVRNLDPTESGVFDVMIDGANELIKYDEDVVSAAISAPNQPPVFLPLMQSRPQILGPGATFQGMLREDDFAEAESDLNAIDQFMAPFAAVLINRSEVNPIGLEMVPPNAVVPALVEVDVTFTADHHMTCQYLVRVRDDQDQLLHDSKDTLFRPEPVVFQPPPPANP